MTHWTATIKPQGLRWVRSGHIRNFDHAGFKEAERKGIKNRKTPYWLARIAPGKDTIEDLGRIQIPTEAWELGHGYEFTRWEDR